MKTIYSFIAILCFAFAVKLNAQAPLNSSLLKPTMQFKYNKAVKNTASKSSTITNEGWFNYGTEAQWFYGASSQINVSYLFPDSTGYANYGGTYAPIWVHHVAELVNFKSPIFSTNPATMWAADPTLTSYLVDSISTVYAYARNNINLNIVDTLIFTIYDNSVSSNMTLSAPITGTYAANYGSDTLAFQTLGFNPTGNFICAPTVTTSPQASPAGAYIFKVLLTDTDTSSVYLREKKIALPVPFASTFGNLIVADMMFKPGYNYTPGEHISTTQNVFYFASYKENPNSGNPSSAFMNHLDCDYGSSQCDYSMSYIISSQNLYNTAGSFNYRYNPAIVYGANALFEHHLISFHLTDTIISPCQVSSQFSVFADSLNPGNYFAYNNSTGSGTLSYLWDFGDGTTSTQPYPFHQYAVPGQYVICLDVTATSGTTTCTNTYCDSSSVQKMATGFVMSQFNVLSPTVTSIIQTKSINEIKIYPNPLHEELNIEFSSNNKQNLHYYLFDALGRTIHTGNIENSKATVNTSNLEKGFYSLSITNEKGSSLKTIKLVK